MELQPDETLACQPACRFEVSSMSVVDKTAVSTASNDRLPEFELECMYDDWDDPETVTVFSTADDNTLATAWLTAECDHAVSLADVR